MIVHTFTTINRFTKTKTANRLRFQQTYVVGKTRCGETFNVEAGNKASMNEFGLTVWNSEITCEHCLVATKEK